MSDKQAAITERNDFIIHLASILGAITCVLAGILLALSIGASIFRWSFINSGPGDLLAGAYGMLAFTVPLYLFCAAWLLFDPVFRPGRIFLLAAVLLPFLTLAFGFSLLRDFESRRPELAFLNSIGQGGLSLAIITTVILECLGILILKQILFNRKQTLPAAVKSTPAESAPAVSDAENAAEPQDASAQKTSGTAEIKNDKTSTEPYKLPEWEPLKSPAAFRELEKNKDEEVLVLDNSAFFPYSKLSGEQLTEDDFNGRKTKEPIEKEPVEKAFVEKELINREPVKIDDFEAVDAFEDTPEIDKPDDDDTFTQFDEPDEPLEFDEAGDFDVFDNSGQFEPESFADDKNDTGPVEENNFYELEQARFDQFDEGGLTGSSAEAAQVPQTIKKKLNKRRGAYSVPVDILTQYPDGQYWIIDGETHREAQILQETLSEFGIQADITGIKKGPVITMFEILPAAGVKLSKIVNLQDNIALRLAASSVRIVAPIPGKHAVGIEVPNKKRSIVSFREIIEGELNQKKDKHKNEIPVVLGKGITGDAVTVDLCQMPHILIAGATGSGKSVCVNSMILSILYQMHPAECRLILIDPKIVELKLYNDIPHLLTPVITEPKKAFQALQYCIFEMERRYACLDSMGVRDIRSYNKRIKERNIAAEHMPYIVVIIDEFADLMATTGKELESTLARLAAMSRAVGIHLVLATQRPSIDVITGLIKANIPSRIAFMVASKMDSRIIIDMVGAEKLLGKGDMLYTGSMDPFPIRMQGAFISEDEVERVVDFVKTLGEPEYIDDEIFFDEDDAESGNASFADGDDPLYDKALEVVKQQGKASASFIQRRLKIGYNRAARLVEEMEERGVVGPAQGSKPRELLHGYSA